MKILNSKVQNYHDHIVIYDKLKKGQWEEVQKELEKQTVPLSTQLKQELQKGKSNLESILKQAKADILKLEKEIQDSFKNKKQTIEGYEI